MPRRNGAASPLHGLDAVEQYTSTHWGRRPKRTTAVSTPALKTQQALVKMGDLRALWLKAGPDHVEVLRPRRPYPVLAFGQRDNKLYIVGGSTAAMAKAGAWGKRGSTQTILRVDYDARKGVRRALVYFYHDHEPPYPSLVILPSGYPAYRGGRYKVAREGIAG